MSAAAVQGVLTAYRTMADGSLRLTIELDELQAHEFHQAFTGINLAVAVARLNGTQPEETP